MADNAGRRALGVMLTSMGLVTIVLSALLGAGAWLLPKAHDEGLYRVVEVLAGFGFGMVVLGAGLYRSGWTDSL